MVCASCDASLPDQRSSHRPADAVDTGDPVDEGPLLDLLNVAVFEVVSRHREIAGLVQRVIDARGITAQALGGRRLSEPV